MAQPLIKIGKVYFIGQTTNITTKRGPVINKRELYLDVERLDGRTQEVIGHSYPKFELSGNACNVLDKMSLGDKVAVLLDVEGRFYDGGDKNPDGSVRWRHINSVIAYNVLTMAEYKERYGIQQTDANEPASQDYRSSLLYPSPNANVDDRPQETYAGGYGQTNQNDDLPFR